MCGACVTNLNILDEGAGTSEWSARYLRFNRDLPLLVRGGIFPLHLFQLVYFLHYLPCMIFPVFPLILRCLPPNPSMQAESINTGGNPCVKNVVSLTSRGYDP